MASVSGRERMISSINDLTGRSDCTEAVLAQQRPVWAFLLFMPIFLVVFIVVASLDIPSFLAGAVAGALAASSFVTLTDYWIIARAGESVVLARSSKLSAKALEVVKTLPVPQPVEIENAILSKKAVIDGERFYVARQFEKRLRQVLGEK